MIFTQNVLCVLPSRQMSDLADFFFCFTNQRVQTSFVSKLGVGQAAKRKAGISLARLWWNCCDSVCLPTFWPNSTLTQPLQTCHSEAANNWPIDEQRLTLAESQKINWSQLSLTSTSPFTAHTNINSCGLETKTLGGTLKVARCCDPTLEAVVKWAEN